MQRLRPEDEVDIGRAPDDRRALLARDATADADDEIGTLGLERAHAAEIVEHALLRLLAHRARVEQDDVGILGTIGQREAVCRLEHVGHLARVVLVHLAAERTDVELLRHGGGRDRRSDGRILKSLKGREL